MKQKVFTLIIIIFPISFFAQGYDWVSPARDIKKSRNLSVDGGFGLRMYVGDIQTQGAIFNKMKQAYGVDIRYQTNRRSAFELQVLGRQYMGKSNHGGYEDALGEMKGKLWQGAVFGQLDLLKWEDLTVHQFTTRDPVTKANVYLGIGFGVSLFHAWYTDRRYKTLTIKNDATGKDSISVFPVDKSNSAGGVGMYVPIQFGFRYRFKPNLYINVELIQYQFYLNKNMDALVSNKYDGMVLLPMVKMGYTFGQVKRKGDIRVKRRKK